MMPTAETVVVDTDVVSFLFRNDTRAARYRPYLTGRVLTISFMTLAELDQWVLDGAELGLGATSCHEGTPG